MIMNPIPSEPKINVTLDRRTLRFVLLAAAADTTGHDLPLSVADDLATAMLERLGGYPQAVLLDQPVSEARQMLDSAIENMAKVCGRLDIQAGLGLSEMLEFVSTSAALAMAMRQFEQPRVTGWSQT